LGRDLQSLNRLELIHCGDRYGSAGWKEGFSAFLPSFEAKSGGGDGVIAWFVLGGSGVPAPAFDVVGFALQTVVLAAAWAGDLMLIWNARRLRRA